MWSIYRTGGGNSSQHLIVLGLAENFGQEVGIDSGGIYELSYGYRDEFAHALISGNATRRLGATTMLVQYGSDYDRSGSDYLRQVVENFPADMLTRAYASAIRVIELPYHQKLALPQKEFLHVPHRLLVIRDRFQRALAPVWLLIVAAALFALTVKSVRIGLFVMLLVFYYRPTPRCSSASGTIFISNSSAWWALGFVVSLSRWTDSRRGRRRRQDMAGCAAAGARMDACGCPRGDFVGGHRCDPVDPPLRAAPISAGTSARAVRALPGGAARTRRP